MLHNKLRRCLLLFFAAGFHSYGEAQDEVVLSKFETAWKARADAVKSLEIAWHARLEHHALPGDTVEANEQFVFDQVDAEHGRWRFSVMGILADHGEDVLQDQAVITNSGGGRCVTFFPEGSRGYPIASISQKGKTYLRHLHLIPIRLAYFPFDADHGMFSNQEWAEPIESGYHETDCLLLKAGQKRVWVKNTPPYLPLRYVEVRQDSGKIRYDFRLQYAAELQDSFPQLKGWSFVEFSADGKKVVERREVTVTRFKPNQQPANELFTQEFPHGTWVNDSIIGQSFIFRVGQPDRVIKSHETVADYKKMLNVDPVPKRH